MIKMDELRYLRSTVQSNRKGDSIEKKREESGWSD